MIDSGTEWIDTAEAAQLTGYNRSYLYQLVSGGKVRSKKLLGRIRLYDKADLLRYAERAREHPRGGPREGSN